MILEANIIPPTAQNQRSVESDLRELVARSIDSPPDKLTRSCELAIRNYDPCISCAAHFLKLNIERN
jgi:coenzyme F420-reducing hydrogenase alpha subunit